MMKSWIEARYGEGCGVAYGQCADLAGTDQGLSITRVDRAPQNPSNFSDFRIPAQSIDAKKY
jgi:hypothetical protein